MSEQQTPVVSDGAATWIWVAVIVVLLVSRGGCTPAVISPSTPSLIVMLHESQHGPLSPDALGAARELAESGREVRVADDDEVNGLGETPDWLKPALAKGREVMGGSDDASQKDDALILLNGEQLVKAIKLPATKAEIVEACK